MASSTGETITEQLPFDGGRLVTVVVPSVPAEAMVVAADGGWHTAGLAEALAAAELPGILLVGVHGPPEDGGRMAEYVLGVDEDRFTAHEVFFVHEVRRHLASRFGVTCGPERTAVWGASLGAELALAVGLRHPGVFGAVLAASPGAGFRPPGSLTGRLPRTYLVAGDEEPFFVANARRWERALRAAGAEAVLTVREGGHGGDFWLTELPLMARWAFGL